MSPGPATSFIEDVEQRSAFKDFARLCIRVACNPQHFAARDKVPLHRHGIMRNEAPTGEADVRQITAHRPMRRIELFAPPSE